MCWMSFVALVAARFALAETGFVSLVAALVVGMFFACCWLDHRLLPYP